MEEELGTTEDLIDLSQAGNRGLSPKKWKEQLMEIRELNQPPHSEDGNNE